MIWVQSILFFIFGSAVTGFLVMLIFPIVWRRALFLANKAVRMAVPVSLNEVEVERDFLRAEHATAVARLEELLKISENRFAEVLLRSSKVMERNYFLAAFEQETRELAALNKGLGNEILVLKQELNAAKSTLRAQDNTITQLTMAETNYQQALATIKKLREDLATNDEQDLNGLDLRGEGYIRGQQKPIDIEISRLYEDNKNLLEAKEQSLNVLREQIKTMAAILVADVAAKEGDVSPILELISKAENADSLAGLINKNVASISSKSA